MLLCIMGKSGSGKDYIANKISKDFNIPILVTYTTRDKRINEINGREHWFISKEEMENIKKNKEMIAYTKIGDIEYCGLYEDIKDKDIIYIIDPNGVEYLMEKYPNIDIRVMYVYADNKTRKKRAMNRDKKDYKKEYRRRVKEEKERFKNMNGMRIDYWIVN